jgi:23S rRNA (cytidine1920-2'-O)/16S rRNA (cytidine1409-2'-O)-methyltransferase
VSNKQRFVALAQRIRQLHICLGDPVCLISSGRVRVNGIVISNPRARIPRGAAVTIAAPPRPPRGARKLAAALDAFAVPVSGRVALDVGAAAGGFTHALLAAGARRVYAVDAGHGQLLGSLRADGRVVSLERTNLGVLTRALVPDVVEVIAIDLSYLSLARAAPQLEAVAIAPAADLVALVKPMYELGLGHPPADADQRVKAVELAAAAFEGTGWRAPRSMESPVPGRRGAVEHLIHLRRGQGDTGPHPPSAEARAGHRADLPLLEARARPRAATGGGSWTWDAHG